jgi:hypothetical protein
MKNRERQIYNTILIHTARVWERVRLEQKNEEMPYDNIASTEIIEEVATDILDCKLIREFLKALKKGKSWDWEEESGEGFSDTFIESMARDKIINNWLEN